MVCIAAFIILAVAVLAIPVLRIINRKAADTIWKLFKKAVYCFTRRATFRKCDSTFKDDVKNSVLRKVVIKHPKAVKPLGITIEILSVLIILVTVWSLLVGVKSGLALFVYGTCDITTPAACSLDSSESCSIDGNQIDFWQDPLGWTGNWFVEFGEAFAAIPVRLQHWDAQKIIPENAQFFNTEDPNKPYALDIFDPGCIICRKSFNNQLKSGFFDNYNVASMIFVIKTNDEPRYANSTIIASYIEAVRLTPLKNASPPAEWQIIKRLFTENDAGLKIDYQTAFNDHYNESIAKRTLQRWLHDFGYSQKEISKIVTDANNKEVKAIIENTADVVKNQIRTRKIPTMIFDGRRHEGLFTQ